MYGCTGINKLTGRTCGRQVVPGLDKCEKHARRTDMLRILLSQEKEIERLSYREKKLESRLGHVDAEHSRLISEIRRHL